MVADILQEPLAARETLRGFPPPPPPAASICTSARSWIVSRGCPITAAATRRRFSCPGSEPATIRLCPAATIVRERVGSCPGPRAVVRVEVAGYWLDTGWNSPDQTPQWRRGFTRSSVPLLRDLPPVTLQSRCKLTLNMTARKSTTFCYFTSYCHALFIIPT